MGKKIPVYLPMWTTLGVPLAPLRKAAATFPHLHRAVCKCKLREVSRRECEGTALFLLPVSLVLSAELTLLVTCKIRMGRHSSVFTWRWSGLIDGSDFTGYIWDSNGRAQLCFHFKVIWSYGRNWLYWLGITVWKNVKSVQANPGNSGATNFTTN